MNVFLKRSPSPRSVATDADGSISAEPVEAAPRKSFEGRLQRFSFIGEKRLSTGKPTQTPPHQRKHFEATLRRVEDSVSLLSTSTGVRFKPPKILVDLADMEKAKQCRLLMADERIALSSLLGWDGKDAEGRGMSGTLGFVRYQKLSVLQFQRRPEGSPASTISSPTSSTLSTTGLSICGKSSWMTYCYYSSSDKLLGDMINDLARNVNLPCEQHGCLFTRGQHEIRMIHGGTRIVIRTSSDVEDSADNVIQMWQSCAVCGAKTSRTNMHDGTLYVLLQLLEILFSSDASDF
jgi:1-phosphatidylinositol-3-phosphate 5-kinase